MVNYLLVVIFIWLLGLSYFVFRLRNHYYNLINGTKKEKLDEILDQLIDQGKANRNELALIKKEVGNQIESSKLHLQKTGLVRFNPFDRVGGEQSFVVSFLDAEDNGIIFNFIYTRDGLRVYTKKVKKGKGEGYNLSEEERELIGKSS